MPKKILLADDSITIQKVVGITFANEDVELTVVDNGADAVTKAKEIQPDLVLADVVMPGKDGYEVCREIKSDPGLASVPVVLLAGTFEPFDEAKSKESGADDQITKPFESQALLEKVREHLKNAPVAAPAAAAEVQTAATPVEDAASEDADDVWDMSEEMVAEETPAPVAAAPAAEDDVWGDDDFGDLGEMADEAASAVAEPEMMEEADSSDEELWGDMDLGGEEEVAVESPAAVEEDVFDFEEEVAPAPVVADTTPPAVAAPELDLAVEPSVEAAPELDLAVEPSVEEAPELDLAVEPSVEEAPEPVEVAPSPVEPPSAESQTTPAVAAGGISEAEMETVVSKVAREIIEKIAWEVVPELAETLIKEEIKKLKGA